MKKIYFIITLTPLFLLLSCQTAMEKNSKYQKPTWLEGKIYTVAKSIPEVSMFAECIERSGLDKILDKSGLYTLMAPTDEAFSAYLEANSYQSIDDIDSLELKQLVEIHIVLNPWSKDQMRQLNTDGWIDTNEDEPQFTGFKRETALQLDNKEYTVREFTGNPPVIDPGGSSTRMVYSSTKKYAPLFFSEYMKYVGVEGTDLAFYYGDDFRYESSEIYFAGAKLLSTGVDLNGDGSFDESYAAENGYVYLIDRVIEPLMSADEMLFDAGVGVDGYSNFGDLINKYATFNYNEDATYDQEGAEEGGEYTKLYDINYDNLAFNIYNEYTYSPTNYSIKYHNALFAPTNFAFSQFQSNVLGNSDEHYGSFLDLPSVLRDFIVNHHMLSQSPYYPSQAGPQGSLYNAAEVRVDLSGIGLLDKKFGSNSTFVGLDQVLMPTVFSSVAGPILLRYTYSSFLIGLYEASLFEVLASPTIEYSLFAIPDLALETDSSLIISYTDDFFNGITNTSAKAQNRSEDKMENIPFRSTSGTSVTNLIKGQIALGTPQGICEKEFLRTLSGYYISFETSTGFVWGGDSSVYGYMGDSVMEIDYLTTISDNYGDPYGMAPVSGNTYTVDYWMQFPKTIFTYSYLKVGNNELFYDYIEDAGLLDNARLNFLTEGEALTIFVPTDAALLAYGADTLPADDLELLIKSHFVTGINMFTDNILRTPLVDEYYTIDGRSIKIGSSDPDKIDICTQAGDIYTQVEENDLLTNKMFLGWDNGDETDDNTSASKEGVGISVIVHLVDDVISPDILF